MQSPLIDLIRNSEPARYALLRRLAPAIRHDMASGFQPVTMLATIIEKRLLTSSPDMPTLVKNSSEMRSLSIAATHTSLNLIGWMATDAGARVALGKGIADALHLVTTELSFRGLKFINQTEGQTIQVMLEHVRGVFLAALLALTDAASSHANILLTAALDGHNILVTIALTDIDATHVTTAPNEAFEISLAAYRSIGWDDVQAIADADNLSVIHKAGSVELRLPILTTQG